MVAPESWHDLFDDWTRHRGLPVASVAAWDAGPWSGQVEPFCNELMKGGGTLQQALTDE